MEAFTPKGVGITDTLWESRFYEVLRQTMACILWTPSLHGGFHTKGRRLVPTPFELFWFQGDLRQSCADQAADGFGATYFFGLLRNPLVEMLKLGRRKAAVYRS